MVLALDVRNSGITAGFRDGEAWSVIVRLGPDRSADELGLFLELAARRAGLGAELSLEDAWISSVVPALTSRATEAVASAFGVEARVVGPGTKTGIKIRTDAPSELGTDIVCAAVAARAAVAGAAVIVDFGAALVLSALNGQGELVGVSIAPGLEMAARALHDSAAQLPEVGLAPPRAAIGRNTVQAVRSGIVVGYAHLVRGLAADMASELGEPVTILGTGDEAGRALLPASGSSFYPNLTLDGLVIVAEKNAGADARA